MRAIFCGTPEIAVPALLALASISEVVGVVCQPDRPAGRGMKVRPPAVKACAEELGLEVFQPAKVRDGLLLSWMQGKGADFALVIAYGRILGPDVLAAPRLGCINLHASLLPEYRGAAPIARCLMDGRKETGVCLMQMDAGMDTGDVLSCHRMDILPEENAGHLAERLGALAAQVTRTDVPRFYRGELTRTKQDETAATSAPPISKEDAHLCFTTSAERVTGQVLGLAPKPGVSCELRRDGVAPRRMKILHVRPWQNDEALAPGQVRWAGSHLLFGTATLPVEILSAQPEGKKPQDPSDLKNGRVFLEGDQLA